MVEISKQDSNIIQKFFLIVYSRILQLFIFYDRCEMRFNQLYSVPIVNWKWINEITVKVLKRKILCNSSKQFPEFPNLIYGTTRIQHIKLNLLLFMLLIISMRQFSTYVTLLRIRPEWYFCHVTQQKYMFRTSFLSKFLVHECVFA